MQLNRHGWTKGTAIAVALPGNRRGEKTRNFGELGDFSPEASA